MDPDDRIDQFHNRNTFAKIYCRHHFPISIFIIQELHSSPRLRPIPPPLPLRIPPLKLPPNILKPLLHNPHPFKLPRFPQLIKRIQINPIPFLPIQNRVEIATSFGGIEIGKRLQERIGPDVRVNVDGSLTHDVLEKIVDAV